MIKKIAHRGDKTHAKENTLKAFMDALKSPEYVGFECDVRMTKDKKLAIIHDPIYKGSLVKTTLYKDLGKVPVLSDVLKLRTGKMIMVDVKDPFVDIDILHKELNKHENIYVISFYNNVIKALFKKKRNYKVGILNYVFNTEDKHFDYDFLCILMATLNPKIIRDYKAKGKMLVIYGTNEDKIKDLYPYYIVD